MQRDHHLMPFVAALAGLALFSLMDAFMKQASLAVGAYSALTLRSLMGLALVAPVWWFSRARRPGPAAMRIHLIRGVVGAAMAFTFFWGIARLPLAEAIALSFTAPLIALYLAAIVLGETVAKSAVAASLMGLVGVVVIAAGRMGGEGSHPEAAWGIAAILASSVLYAWNLILQRQQALLARPLEVATFQNGIVSAVLLLFAPFFLDLPAAADWPPIAWAAVLAVGAAMILAWAYARAEAQVLVPVEYTGFLWASLFGWLFFSESVTLPTLGGAALIVTACLIAAPRKRPEQTAA